jgi:hypothetical protein
MPPLEKELENALMELYEKWKSFMRPKNRFLQMLRREGPVRTVKHLLTGTPSSGFDDLVKAKQIQLTVEWLALHPQWLLLFTDGELDVARKRVRVALASS